MSANNQNKPLVKKSKDSKWNFVTILACISGGIGLLSILFILCPGITYPYTGYYNSGFNLASMIFGNGMWASLNPGLLIGFIIMIISSLVCFLAFVKQQFGLISCLGFITSAILFFCIIPLYGNYSAGIGSGAICIATFNLLCAILSFIFATYR